MFYCCIAKVMQSSKACARGIMSFADIRNTLLTYVTIPPTITSYRRNCNIMRKINFHCNKIKELLINQRIATMHELKRVLGTSVRMTVIRKLRELSYHSSYSHKGKFYTLNELVHFDSEGLWSFDDVFFSKYGTLLETCKCFINDSDAGHSVRELESILSIEVKESLLCLYRKGEITREKISGCNIYFSIKSKVRKMQLQLRKDHDLKSVLKPDISRSDLLMHELKASILLFFTFLDERQRRLYVGLESLKYGYGGDKQIANLFGINAQTVSKGRLELLSKEFDTDKIRKKGGGRISKEKKTPES